MSGGAEPPSLIQRAISGARRLGWRTAWAVLVYSVRKAGLDVAERIRRSWPRRWVAPGELQEIEVSGDRVECTFDRAELEVRFLAPDLVRLTWTPGQLPVPYAIDRTDWTGPAVTHEAGARAHSLVAGELRLDLTATGAVTVRTRDGALVCRNEPPRRRGRRWAGASRLHPHDQVHGLGERAAPFDLRPGRHGMWNAEQDGSYHPGDDPLYLTAPVYLVVGHEGSHFVFHENSHWGEMYFNGGVDWFFDGGAARTYVVPGPPDRALARYTELTGRTPLPPDWALGYHQARWGYETQDQVEAVVDGFEHHDLPFSAVHLDIDHMVEYRVFTLDHSRFPDLPGLAARLAEHDRHLVAIVDPGVAADRQFTLYADGKRAGRFATRHGRVFRGPAWPGWVGYPDFTDPDTRRWWGSQYQALLDEGIDGIWHDMNEPAAFAISTQSTLPAQVDHAMDGRGGRHQEAHNIYALCMARAAREALEARRPGQCPFLFSRSGWAGIQRYAWTWTGDAESTWPMLRRTVAILLNLGLSGMPYTGSDIGGFSGGPGPELYLRWFELGAFSPLFRTHCAFDSPPREPWEAAPDHLDELRELLRLRYRLIPYLQSMAAEHLATGAPLMRPLWWPDGNPALLEVDDAFLLGDSLLVAPVLDQGATTREVLLPNGEWRGWWDGAEVEGGQTVTLDAPLGRPGLLWRPGSAALDQARST